MFYLFWFEEDNSSYIAKESEILTKGERIVNKNYDVKYENGVYSGKLLSKSIVKSGLKNLGVSDEGQLIIPSLMKMKGTNKNETQKKFAKKKSCLKRRRTANEQQYNQECLQVPDDEEEDQESDNVENIKKTKTSQVHDKLDEILEVEADLDNLVEQETEKIPEEKQNNQLTFGIDGNLEITDDTIRIVEQFLVFLKNSKVSRDQMKVKNDYHLDDKCQIEKMPKWHQINSSKKELYPSTGVWIHISALEEYEDASTCDPSKLTRLILRDLIGTSTLKKSCALGLKGDRPGINSQVLRAVEKFIQQKYFGGKKWPKFHETINQLCQNLRSDEKKRKDHGSSKPEVTQTDSSHPSDQILPTASSQSPLIVHKVSKKKHNRPPVASVIIPEILNTSADDSNPEDQCSFLSSLQSPAICNQVPQEDHTLFPAKPAIIPDIAKTQSEASNSQYSSPPSSQSPATFNQASQEKQDLPPVQSEITPKLAGTSTDATYPSNSNVPIPTYRSSDQFYYQVPEPNHFFASQNFYTQNNQQPPYQAHNGNNNQYQPGHLYSTQSEYSPPYPFQYPPQYQPQYQPQYPSEYQTGNPTQSINPNSSHCEPLTSQKNFEIL